MRDSSCLKVRRVRLYRNTVHIRTDFFSTGQPRLGGTVLAALADYVLGILKAYSTRGASRSRPNCLMNLAIPLQA